MAGVSCATLGNSHFVLIAGIAGMVAGLLLMGSSAYLAAKRERGIYEEAFGREKEAAEDNRLKPARFCPLAIPFFFLSGIPAVIVAAIVSLLTHFAVYAAKSFITIRSWWASGFEYDLN